MVMYCGFRKTRVIVEASEQEMNMNGNALALGRNHASADVGSLTDFGDCFRVNLSWNDGAFVYVIYDTKAEAVAHLNRIGFYA